MALAPGTRLGPYDIVAPLGAGGMGEVYRARDTRLGRDVALKVLPAAFAHASERMVRFEREAKVLASLNHPNIASIYGLEESNGVRALVMELVEGRTLAERIKQGPIALDEALPIAKQIAEGLEYAHNRGIIHRDLKPSNIKLRADGAVKILDFGLAKALEGEVTEEESQNSPTLSAAATRAGLLLGTAAYMSPEQARGKRVDRRADIWAFGCVLYEMLTGRGTFSGETTSDILACVIRAEPDWAALPASTTPRIRELLLRCLQKDARQRLQAIGDARIAIEEILSGSRSTSEAGTGGTAPNVWQGRIGWALLGLGLALGAAGAGLIAWYLRPARAPQATGRVAFTFPAPQEKSKVWVVGGFPLADFTDVDISADGNEIAYLASDGKARRVFLRPMDRLEGSGLPGTDGALSPFFSPDGQWIGFFAEGKLKKVSIHGGEPVALCEVPSMNRGASWGPDDRIIFAPTLFGGLMRVSASGGAPELFSSPDASKGERSYRWPEILPGEKAVVYVIAETKDVGFFTQSKIAVERIDTHEKKILPIQGTYPRYSPSGHLLFAREGRLFAVPFDAKRLEVTGSPVPVLDGVKSSPNSGNASFMVSVTGSLVYRPQDESEPEGKLVWVDRKNQVQALLAPSRRYSSPAISPDGQRIAISIFSGNHVDVWVYEIPHGTLTRLTFDENSTAPLWSVDGKRIAFRTTRGVDSGILWKPADGSGTEENLVPRLGLITIPTSWSPDGKFLAYYSIGTDTGRDIFIAPLQGEREPRPFLQTKFDELHPRFSPDGRWIAYTSNESGQFQVYVQPFPGPGGKWQVSVAGGSQPIWARDGRELFYLSPNSDQVMSVSVTTQPNFSASPPRTVANTPPNLLTTALPSSIYDVSPDGKRFLFVKANAENSPPEEVRVVLNWAEEVKRLTSTIKQP